MIGGERENVILLACISLSYVQPDGIFIPYFGVINMDHRDHCQ